MTKLNRMPPFSATSATAIATTYTPPGAVGGGVDSYNGGIAERLERLKKQILETSERFRIHQETRAKLVKRNESTPLPVQKLKPPQRIQKRERYELIERRKKLFAEAPEAFEKLEGRRKQKENRKLTMHETRFAPSLAAFDEKLAITLALETVKGNRRTAAKKIGCSESYIKLRIIKAGSHSPLAPFKKIKGRGGPTSTVTNEMIAEALEQYGGKQWAVAEKFSLHPSAIYRRVIRAKDKSPLIPHKEAIQEKSPSYHKEIKRGSGPPPAVSDEVLYAVLEKHGGDRTAAAREVGYVDASVVRNRIRRAKPESPLKKWGKSK